MHTYRHNLPLTVFRRSVVSGGRLAKSNHPLCFPLQCLTAIFVAQCGIGAFIMLSEYSAKPTDMPPITWCLDMLIWAVRAHVSEDLPLCCG